jgi:hypothetical protein
MDLIYVALITSAALLIGGGLGWYLRGTASPSEPARPAAIQPQAPILHPADGRSLTNQIRLLFDCLFPLRLSFKLHHLINKASEERRSEQAGGDVTGAQESGTAQAGGDVTGTQESGTAQPKLDLALAGVILDCIGGYSLNLTLLHLKELAELLVNTPNPTEVVGDALLNVFLRGETPREAFNIVDLLISVHSRLLERKGDRPGRSTTTAGETGPLGSIEAGTSYNPGGRSAWQQYLGTLQMLSAALTLRFGTR